MKVAVMQPYAFPYIGYFQLIYASDLFVFYDDVNFIKQGWINRNRILINGVPYLFTIPLQQMSPFNEIKSTFLHPHGFPIWRQKFLKSLRQAYCKAPYFNEIFPITEEILCIGFDSISSLAMFSVERICAYVGLNRRFEVSSVAYPETKGLERADRLIEICLKNNGKEYVNPVGGENLYNKAYFKSKGIELSFISPSSDIIYSQGKNHDFFPSLSILDVLMFNSKADVGDMLKRYILK